MGGKGGDVHQSENIGELDQLGFESILGLLSGQSLGSSPTLASSIVAAQLGGDYNEDSGVITFPDGSTATFDATTGAFVGDESDYLNMANQTYTDLEANVFSNPNSVYNLFSQQDTYYNPETGRYETLEVGEEAPELLTSDYYLENYGDFFDEAYDPLSYSENYQQDAYTADTYDPSDPYETSEYSEYDYSAPQLEVLENISDTARQNIYQSGADQIISNFQDMNESTEDWIAMQGSNLSSGRAAQLYEDNQMDRDAELNALRRDVDTEHELRVYEDAKNVRDMQADYDWQEDQLEGEEARFGQEYGQDESRYAYESGVDESRFGQEYDRDERQYAYESGVDDARYSYEADQDEGRYGYESDYQRGLDKLSTVEGIDSTTQDRAFQEEQADRQQSLSVLTALNDLLRLYSGMDSTAAQLSAAESSAIGSALGGLFGGAGSAVGSALGG